MRLAGLVIIMSAAVAQAQPTTQVLSRVENGLQEAVLWKWSVAPGPALDVPKPTPESGASVPSTADSRIYTIKKGDALAKIASQFNVTVEQLKIANELKGDLIRIDQEIRIPSAEEIALMPVATPKTSSPATTREVTLDADPDVLIMQVHLDRLGFSPGPIDGQSGLIFQRLVFLYQTETGESPELILANAKAAVGDPLTTYELRPQDFGWIRQPPSTPKSSKTQTPEERVAGAYSQLIGAPSLLYRSAWEFVAERFHCSEAFLRKLNPTLKTSPAAGTVFRVPKVEPFEIETALKLPIRPQANPTEPMKAIIADLARLEIMRGDKMIAAFPLTVARPGLRGRGEWVILDTILNPQLSTRREPVAASEALASVPGGDSTPGLRPMEEVLPSGPRNPVGLLWINLAKADDLIPLPYGLHGTSLPDQMAVTESLGGFRLANWDIVRAARLLPEGTPLRWRLTTAKPPTAPAIPPATQPTTPDAPGDNEVGNQDQQAPTG